MLVQLQAKKKPAAAKRQPSCPPERTARGFSLGRGRAPTTPPGAPIDPPAGPPAPPGAPPQSSDPPRAMQVPTEAGQPNRAPDSPSRSLPMPSPRELQEGNRKPPQQQQSQDAANVSLGHSLLAALQQGKAATPQVRSTSEHTCSC